MTLENARVLRKELLKVGRTIAAEDIERRYPELKKEDPKKAFEEIKKDLREKKDGKVRKR